MELPAALAFLISVDATGNIVFTSIHVPPDRARYFPEDSKYLLTRPDRVMHYSSSDLG